MSDVFFCTDGTMFYTGEKKLQNGNVFLSHILKYLYTILHIIDTNFKWF